MSETAFDVLGIGNAIVDILVQTDDEFLDENDLIKGSMGLTSFEDQMALYAKTGQAIESSGGSAANTMAGIAALGGRAAFAGRVKSDQLGHVFMHDIRGAGVTFDSPPAEGGPETATCLVMITPDGQRTMQTYLGACVEFAAGDLDLDQVAKSSVTYLEGYLWDSDSGREAFLAAADAAHAAGRKVSLSLSDPFCVDRHRDGFIEFCRDHVDILFANEDEILSLFQCDDVTDASVEVKDLVEIAALTRSEHGSMIVRGGELVMVPAAHVDKVVDTTGAGDAYAAGFLTALTHGKDLKTAATLGGLLAAVIIQQIGARPTAAVQDLLRGLDD